MRWTTEEVALLRQGMVRGPCVGPRRPIPIPRTGSSAPLPSSFVPPAFRVCRQRTYGTGNWTAIAAFMQTRTPLQVKNHARHLMQSNRWAEVIGEDIPTPGARRPNVPERPRPTVSAKTVPGGAAAGVHARPGAKGLGDGGEGSGGDDGEDDEDDDEDDDEEEDDEGDDGDDDDDDEDEDDDDEAGDHDEEANTEHGAAAASDGGSRSAVRASSESSRVRSHGADAEAGSSKPRRGGLASEGGMKPARAALIATAMRVEDASSDEGDDLDIGDADEDALLHPAVLHDAAIDAVRIVHDGTCPHPPTRQAIPRTGSNADRWERGM